MNSRTSSPIGVFDSGLGGLSVFRHLRACLPHENYIYIADSEFAPYGDKSPDQILERVTQLSRFLLEQNCKALVIACNTATAMGVQYLRALYDDVPIIGMEPAVKPAVAASKNKVIGVLATTGTLRSAQFAALLDRFGSGVELITQPCPGVVELIEAGQHNSSAMYALLSTYLQAIQAAQADTIVLGCTHYPFIAEQVKSLMPYPVCLIDTGLAVAKRLAFRLNETQLLNLDTDVMGQALYYSSLSKNIAQSEQVAQALLDDSSITFSALTLATRL